MGGLCCGWLTQGTLRITFHFKIKIMLHNDQTSTITSFSQHPLKNQLYGWGINRGQFLNSKHHLSTPKELGISNISSVTLSQTQMALIDTKSNLHLVSNRKRTLISTNVQQARLNSSGGLVYLTRDEEVFLYRDAKTFKLPVCNISQISDSDDPNTPSLMMNTEGAVFQDGFSV